MRARRHVHDAAKTEINSQRLAAAAVVCSSNSSHRGVLYRVHNSLHNPSFFPPSVLQSMPEVYEFCATTTLPMSTCVSRVWCIMCVAWSSENHSTTQLFMTQRRHHRHQCTTATRSYASTAFGCDGLIQWGTAAVQYRDSRFLSSFAVS